MKLISVILVSMLLLWGQKIEVNFRNLSLQDFVKMVAKMEHKNVLITNNLSGKVNFISVKALSTDELWQVLLNVLKSRGYTIISNKQFLEVVKIGDAIKLANFNKSNLSQITTEIINLKYLSAESAKSNISGFLSNYGKIIVNNDNNFLIVTDFPENIKKIKFVLRKIDKGDDKSVNFIKLKYANASEVVKKVEKLISFLKIKKVKISADDNSNSLVVISNNDTFNKIKGLVTKFDIKKQRLITKIINLKNTDASDISKIISSIIKDRFKKDMPTITMDKEDNSLILVGDKKKIELLDSIVTSLDIPKKQVYVKVRVLELSNSKVSNIGARLGIVGGSATSSGLYTMSANLGGPAVAFDPGSLGLAMPTVKQGLALGAVFNLLATEGAAKKLSEPSILCVNNTPSTIYVGKTVSVVTQSVVGSNSNDLTKNNFSRQDIGLKMTVKPRIDIDNKVAINIKGLIEDILPGSQVGLPITSKREIDTTAIVENGQNIIIGGLIKNNKDITVSKVPFLGDIPILGALFRNKQKNNDASTIVIVLTPYIVKDTSELNKLQKILVKLNELEYKFVNKISKKLKKAKNDAKKD